MSRKSHYFTQNQPTASRRKTSQNSQATAALSNMAEPPVGAKRPSRDAVVSELTAIRSILEQLANAEDAWFEIDRIHRLGPAC